MGWVLTKIKGMNDYTLESTVTGKTLKEGTKKEVMVYMKKSLLEDAKYAIQHGGLLKKGGSIFYNLKNKKPKQNITIQKYIDSTIKDWFKAVETY